MMLFVFERKVGRIQTYEAQVRHNLAEALHESRGRVVLNVTVDNPSARLVERLSEIMPNLRLVCLAPAVRLSP